MSKRDYFKDVIAFYAGEEGPGYWEYIDNFCTRQIKVFGERIELYQQEIGNYNDDMVDHNLSENDFKTSGSRISQSEFESIWAKGSTST